MKKFSCHQAVLLCGLLAAAGVQAQVTPAAGSSDLPPKAGEASTQTHGVPNARTTNMPMSQAPAAMTHRELRQDTQRMGAAATTPVPGKAGEASTMVHGVPNVNPNDPALKMGWMGDRSRIGVPATLPYGSPSVFQGGTPQ